MIPNVLNLTIKNLKEEKDEIFDFQIKSIVNAGYTGRDQKAVQKHIDELKEIGVPAPDKIPVYFVKSPNLMTTDDGFYAVDKENTGEVEYILLIAENGIYVGVGSDHTDRELEKTNIPKGKQMCPNFISKDVWKYDDVKEHWDDLELRAWIYGENKVLFQETTLKSFMSPEELMERIKKLCGGKLDVGTVIYSGTVAAKIDGYPFSKTFDTELFDKKHNRKLTCGYNIHLMNPVG